MSTNTSFSTFVRPQGSPVYGPTGPSLILPRRSPVLRSSRSASLTTAPSSLDVSGEARRQIAQVLALIHAADIALERPAAVEDASAAELMQSLQQLETRLAERERGLEEREFRLAERQRDLAEGEGLVRAREALLAASRKTRRNRPPASPEEQAALLALKAELDRQEASLKENREALREREKFLEESEERLFEKVQQHQEKETELEQREEELVDQARSQAELRAASGACAAPVVKRVFDEFNE